MKKSKKQRDREAYRSAHMRADVFTEEEKYLWLDNDSLPARIKMAFLFFITSCIAGYLFGCLFVPVMHFLTYLNFLLKTGFDFGAAKIMYLVYTEGAHSLSEFAAVMAVFPFGVFGLWGAWRTLFRYENPFRYFKNKPR